MIKIKGKLTRHFILVYHTTVFHTTLNDFIIFFDHWNMSIGGGVKIPTCVPSDDLLLQLTFSVFTVIYISSKLQFFAFSLSSLDFDCLISDMILIVDNWNLYFVYFNYFRKISHSQSELNTFDCSLRRLVDIMLYLSLTMVINFYAS